MTGPYWCPKVEAVSFLVPPEAEASLVEMSALWEDVTQEDVTQGLGATVLCGTQSLFREVPNGTD